MLACCRRGYCDAPTRGHSCTSVGVSAGSTGESIGATCPAQRHCRPACARMRTRTLAHTHAEARYRSYFATITVYPQPGTAPTVLCTANIVTVTYRRSYSGRGSRISSSTRSLKQMEHDIIFHPAAVALASRQPSAATTTTIGTSAPTTATAAATSQ